MSEFLLEIRSEDLPARVQARGEKDLQSLFIKTLEEHGLSYDSMHSFSTPRRLGLVIYGLPTVSPDSVEEKKGPKIDAPEKAIEGFLTSTGLTLEQCEKRETPKGTFLFAQKEIKGRPATEILKIALKDVFTNLSWPKSMRWGNTSFAWSRPIRGLLAIFEGKALDFEIDFQSQKDPSSLKTTNSTLGHRFLSEGEITVQNFEDYKKKLHDANVMIEASDRKQFIEDALQKIATEKGLEIVEDAPLLNEVTGLIEWPVPLLGTIDEKFMSLPTEVLTSFMRSHQKYFALQDKQGKLAPHFIVVSNLTSKDGGKVIVAGNEKVLRARLSDAEFFWTSDQKTSLEDFKEKLKSQIFHEKLGTLEQKISRLEVLTPFIGELLDKSISKQDYFRAATLAKADLASGMVGEFPELQGIMGCYYAKLQNESVGVAEAIGEHYKPQGEKDSLPTSSLSKALSIADKIDTLVGFFSLKMLPTGSKDPFALRRSALGILRILRENEISLPLVEVIKKAHDLLDVQNKEPLEETLETLKSFFLDRLKVYLKEEGVRHDLISAVDISAWNGDVMRLLLLVQALSEFISTPEGENLLMAYRRARNIVSIEEKKSGKDYNQKTVIDLFKQQEEKSLYQALEEASTELSLQLEEQNFTTCMKTLSQIRPHVDSFFDHVTVNDEDTNIRENRLKLLAMIRSTMEKIADFSKVEG